MSIIVEIENLSVVYNKIEVLKDVSFSVQRGDFIGLVGPNGAGKTTLAKCILGLVQVSKGRIVFSTKNGSEEKKSITIGYLPQNTNKINVMFPALVEEVVGLGLFFKKKYPKYFSLSDKEKIFSTLEMLGIELLQKRFFNTLSGGEQQKVLLGRAIISTPELLILDEPSSALDPEARADFFKLISQINKDQNTTIILITHDTGYIGKYANKLLYIDGRVVFFGRINDSQLPSDIGSCFERSDDHIIWHQHS